MNYKKEIKICAYGLYLGMILPALFNIGLQDWQWWVVVVPIAILVTWSRNSVGE